MRRLTGIILAVIFFTGCKFSKSVEKDLITGLTTKGDLLSCDDVYFTINNEKTTRTSFDYGEILYIVYDNVQGFEKENNKVFPKMQILVLDEKGDTAMWAGDLYAEYTEGMDFTPLQLTADLTVASPIKSGGNYELNVYITDRKGTGSFNTKMNFSVNRNDKLVVEPAGAVWDEAYIYSQDEAKVINDNRIRFEENVYFIVEGLRGFKETDGLVYPGLSLRATDSAGNLILDYTDLFSEYDKTGVLPEDLASRASAHFRISGINFNNPMKLEMKVWDKRSDASLVVKTELEVIRE